MSSTEITPLNNTRKRAAETVDRDPKFFDELAKQQKPKYKSIGCSHRRKDFGMTKIKMSGWSS